MFENLIVQNIANLRAEDKIKLNELIEVFNCHAQKNHTKDEYYEGHIELRDVNLGIALPDGLKKLKIGCEWGSKCVDVLAARSMFDGYVGSDGNDVEVMTQIMRDNRLIAEYMKACRDQLKFGCTFATLSSDAELGCRIRFHSPQTAAAKWDGATTRIGYGFAIISAEENEVLNTFEPTLINLYLEDYTVVLSKHEDVWVADYHENKLGRPLMEPLIWNATSQKPFGRSRLKEAVRRLIQGYVRTLANASIGLEFSTTPQKYLIGITDEQYDALINDKFRSYVGSVLLSTANTETGENPSFGQLSQGNIEPHVQMLRILATQFSAATGLTVTDTGVVNDANPTSSDAILAQSQTLVAMAEQLNASNGDALNTIARMAQAIARNVSLNDLTDEEKSIVAHFKNPAMPSVAVTADAAVKIASARPEFASTDTYLEMIGFDQANIRRIKAQESRVRGMDLITSELEQVITEEGEE